MLYRTQCTQTRLGALGSGASGSSTIRARLLAPAGRPDHCSGGETSFPSHVYSFGIESFGPKAGEVSVKAIAIASTILVTPFLFPAIEQPVVAIGLLLLPHEQRFAALHLLLRALELAVRAVLLLARALQ